MTAEVVLGGPVDPAPREPMPVVPEAGKTGLHARRGGLPLGLLFGTIGVGAGLAVRVFGLDRLGFTICVFKAMTGCPCVTCGTTRALGRLATGDWAGALAMNPLAALVGLALVPWALADLVLLPRGQALELTLSPQAGRWARWVTLAALLSNWAFLIASGR